VYELETRGSSNGDFLNSSGASGPRIYRLYKHVFYSLEDHSIEKVDFNFHITVFPRARLTRHVYVLLLQTYIH